MDHYQEHRDGSASISLELPADAAPAVFAHLTALAKRAIQAGHPGSLDNARADAFSGSLSGRFEGLDDEQVIASLVRAGHEGRSPERGFDIHFHD